MRKSEAYDFVSHLSLRVSNSDRNPKSRGMNWEDDECPFLVFWGEKHEIQSVRYEYKKDTCYFRLMFETLCVKNFSKALNENLTFPKSNARLWTKKKGHYATNSDVQLFGMDWYFDDDETDIFDNDF